jgi:hypothetical protein
MSIIKVYKHKGMLIPIDKATIIDAYCCPWTGKLFAIKSDYIKHLAKIRKNYIHENIRLNNWKKDREEFNSQSDFYKVIEWIETHPDWFIYNAKRNCPELYNTWPEFGKTNIKILELILNFNEHVSNSHNCPRNGVTNWGSDPNKPRGYPGWQGKIGYIINTEVPTFCSQLFKNTGINLGTGSGSKNYSHFEVSFFADDWPIINSQLKMDRVEGILSEKPWHKHFKFVRG